MAGDVYVLDDAALSTLESEEKIILLTAKTYVARVRLGEALRRAAGRLDPAGPGSAPGHGRRTRRKPALKSAKEARDIARESFFVVLAQSGNLGSAAAATTRAYLRRGNAAPARTFAQVLQQEPGAVGQVGDICIALTAVAGEMPNSAWALFDRAELAEILRLAPAEYVRTAFGQNPGRADEALQRLLVEDCPTDADAAAWLDIAATSFLAGRDELSREALGRALAGLDAVADDADRDRLRADANWLQEWYGRRDAVPESELPAIAVLGYRGPERAASSRNIGDYLESLATVAQLVAHPDFAIDQQDERGAAFGTLVAELQARTAAPKRSDAAHNPSVRLYEVDRDASRWAQVPDGAWVVYTGLLPQPQFGVRGDLPLDERLRPIFLSVHVDSSKALPSAAIEYLREHAPIGCRDWSTVLLLQAAGVPAFFAGSVTTTLGGLARRPEGAGTDVLAVDPRGGAGKTDRGAVLSEDSNAVRRRGLVGNLRAALEHLDALAGAGHVRTGRLQSYLAARAVGTAVTYRPHNRSERRLWGLFDVDDAALGAMQRGISEKLAAVYGAILAGKPEEEVYATWRAVCAEDVERAEAFRADVPRLPAPIIDVAAACATIRANMVTVERTQPGGEGSEINVEMSLDGNYKHQLEVVLDSIVANTNRPVRAFVLCRDHTQADYDRMARLFPEVSFVWLPTDSVEYGQVVILCGSVATLDRLLLPDLLPEVSRMVHHDLDALCLADLGELYDVDLQGTPLAAVMSPQKNHLSGFSSLMSRSESFRNDPERSHEYLLRTHNRHRFDYNVLNAGIMTLDLDAMRADDFSRQFMPFVERFKLSDQALLNVYVGARRVELEPGWNWRPWLEQVPEPKIAHWAGPQKPWKPNWVVGRDLWQAAEARLAQRHARAAT